MAGTKAGGKKAAATNKHKYGEDFYAKIGAFGGVATNVPKGFASDLVGPDGLTGKERATVVGVIGGRKSSRRKRY
jgi:hypothetical protein